MTYIPDWTEREEPKDEKCSSCNDSGKIHIEPIEFLDRLPDMVKQLRENVARMPENAKIFANDFCNECMDYFETDEITCPECGGK